ncbi:MAG: cytochrome c [Pseudomonadota bacterium]
MAHEGVENPAVMERMHGMKQIAAHLKVIGDMAKGEAAFEAEAARNAASGIAKHAAAAPALFEAREDDPKSEAKPAIWENFEDFTRLSLELEVIATDLSATISTPEDLRPALQQLGQNCKACHTDYRE